MSEKDVIEKTKTPVTINMICNGLHNLGLKKGDIVLVHSSLSSLGWVCGGAQAVILALMESVGEEGTIAMPAHSGDWSDPVNWSNPPVPKEWVPIIRGNMPAFNKDMTPTRGLGKTAELFRNLPRTLRSDHPLVSFAANGRYSDRITKNHQLNCQFGMDSPLGAMYGLKAKILLLGVGYDSCTSFHLSEVLTGRMPLERFGTSILREGKRQWVEFEDFKYDSDDFEKIGADFEIAYEVKKGKIGNSDCKLFDMKTGVDFATDWLLRNRIK